MRRNDVVKKGLTKRASVQEEDVVLSPQFLGNWRQSSQNGRRTSQIKLQERSSFDKSSSDTRQEESVEPVSWMKLFSYADTADWVSISVGLLMASLTGLCIPLGVILYGEFTALLIDRTVEYGTSTETLMLNWFGGGRVLINATRNESAAALIEDSIAFGISCTALSVLQFLLGVWAVDTFNYSAIRQVDRIRIKFLEAVLKQDMYWYDTNTSMNFAAKVSEDLVKVADGIGEKIGIFTYLVMSFVFSIIIAFAYGWKLTLVVLSCAPVIIITTAIVAKVQSSLTSKELKSYSHAGVVAEEVLGAIRTVVAFSGEQKEIERYRERLEPAKKMGTTKGMYSGVGSGVMWFIIYATYALSFWYGVSLILHDRHVPDPEYTPAVLIIVFFGVLAGAQNVGLTSPHLEAFSTARGSAASIFSIIGRTPAIDSMSEAGDRPDKFSGNIDFKGVHFNYPARPGVKILQGLNLSIKHGETVALVGSSGCGKSTAIQLIQRLYDPAGGSVLVDGRDVKRLNVQWLRSHIGVVGQEPILFATTLKENIRYGNPQCTQEDIEDACRAAYCHNFIRKLPDGYDTMIGERGAQLSGGQKQRIAIARALVSNPKILLLDEATSALDPHSEAKVQKALDAASKGRTTVMVSHRLATVTNADRIVFIEKGQVKEMGTHEELLNKQGFYYQLVMADEPSLLKRGNLAAEKRKILSKMLSVESIQQKATDTTSLGSESSEEEDKDEGEDEEFGDASMWRIMKLNRPELAQVAVGVAAAMVVGGTLPAFAVLFGETYGILEVQDEDYVRRECDWIAILFLLVGIVTGIGTFLQVYMFNIAGVRLTTRLRVDAFAAMLRQEIAWYDDNKNSVGSLASRLAGDCAAVQGATGTRIGAIVQASSTIILGICLSLYYTWKMTLVSLVSVPLVLGSVVIEGRVMGDVDIKGKRAMDDATRIATEAISNIRTIAGLRQERAVLSRYMTAAAAAGAVARRRLRARGCVFSFGQTAPFAGYALSLYYGGVLVASGEVHYKNVIKVSEALIFGAWMMGQALAFAPNFSVAKVSAGRLFKLFDRQPVVHSPATQKATESFKSKGSLLYSDVSFRYPTRPAVQVLRGLDLQIVAGQTIALVGHSGCGKSTCIQLLQRLYDPENGAVYMDGYDIKYDLALPCVRAQLGLVGQEPVLFDKSISDNIAYGDNSRKVKMEEVVQAAKDANIHEFIVGLPLGYNTSLGAKGTQLSGGQKQRIAIARALVRNPRILLLDEATSALDTQSEKIVQEALDRASAGRTCLIIAHRLSTVQNADVICVVDKGQVAEMGTHHELLKLNGIYTELHALQSGAGAQTQSIDNNNKE